MKSVSCGVLIYKFEESVPFILLGHVTKFIQWDIFKGGVELKNENDYETVLDTAQRELREESGLVLDESAFKTAYHYPKYTKRKELWVFPIEDKKRIKPETLFCSTFVPNTQTPEFDRFAWFSYNEALLVVGNGLKNVIVDLFENYIKKD